VYSFTWRSTGASRFKDVPLF